MTVSRSSTVLGQFLDNSGAQSTKLANFHGPVFRWNRDSWGTAVSVLSKTRFKEVPSTFLGFSILNEAGNMGGGSICVFMRAHTSYKDLMRRRISSLLANRGVSSVRRLLLKKAPFLSAAAKFLCHPLPSLGPDVGETRNSRTDSQIPDLLTTAVDFEGIKACPFEKPC